MNFCHVQKQAWRDKCPHDLIVISLIWLSCCVHVSEIICSFSSFLSAYEMFLKVCVALTWSTHNFWIVVCSPHVKHTHNSWIVVECKVSWQLHFLVGCISLCCYVAWKLIGFVYFHRWYSNAWCSPWTLIMMKQHIFHDDVGFLLSVTVPSLP